MKRLVPIFIAGLGLGWLLSCQPGFDLNKGRVYACTRGGDDATQCPDGFHCGKDNFCYPRDAGSARDCDTDDDCAYGWKCGLSGQCHSTTVGGAYVCHDDNDCVSPWRCGPEEICVNPSADALRQGRFNQNVKASRFDVRNINGLPSHLAVSRIFTGRGPGEYQTVSYIYENVWTLAVLGMTGNLPMADDGGYALGQATSVVLDGGSVRALAVVENEAFILDSEGAARLTFSRSGVSYTRMDAPDFAAQALRPVDEPTSGTHSVLAFGGNQFALFDGGTFAPGRVMQLPDGGDVGVIHDMAPIQLAPSQAPTLWAATSAGLLWAARDKNGFLGGPDVETPVWQPVEVPETAVSWLEPRRLHPVQAPWKRSGAGQVLGVEAVSRDGGTTPYVSSFLVDMTGPLPVLDPDGNMTCEGCPAGAELIDMYVSGAFSGGTIVRTRCRVQDGDGGVSEAFTEMKSRVGARCSHFSVELGEPPRPPRRQTLSAPSSPNRHAFADSNGRIWTATTDSQDLVWWPTTGPTTLDTFAMADEGDNFQLGRGRAAVHLIVPEFGLVELRPHGSDRWPGFQAAVEGHPTWRLARTLEPRMELVDVADWNPANGIRRIARVADEDFDLLKAPFQAVAAPLGDGGTELVVTTFDSVLAAPQRLLPDAGPVNLDVRVVPLPRGQIASLVVLPPKTNTTALLNGYLIAQTRLFQLIAFSQTSWRTEEISMPFGDLAEVWADDDRARVAYRDGSVYALPSRVRIADPLPEGQLAWDFAQVCGQAFALAPKGLYKLIPGAGAVGSWIPETIGADVLPEDPTDDWTVGGQLHASGSELFMLTVGAKIVRLAAPECGTVASGN